MMNESVRSSAQLHNGHPNWVSLVGDGPDMQQKQERKLLIFNPLLKGFSSKIICVSHINIVPDVLNWQIQEYFTTYWCTEAQAIEC